MTIERSCTEKETLFDQKSSSLVDPRRTEKGNLKSPLPEILFLTISAVISGANTWTGIESFGESKIDWLRKFYPYAEGTPSHDAISDVFSILDASAFGECFISWVNSVADISEGEAVAIDGKTVRGAASSGDSKYPVHIVSAYASESRGCLGQVAVEEKSNEITAIPKLIELLALKGCVVTVNSMGCQNDIAGKIVDSGADYVLMVKDNQKELKMQVEKMFTVAPCSSAESIDAGHGRIEKRTCTVAKDLTFLDGAEEWKGLASVVKVVSERTLKSDMAESSECRYYISSLKPDAERVNEIVRGHWSVENNLHWMLDVVFREDGQLKRKGNSASNFNIISKIALSLLEKETSVKNSKNNKRLKAALDDRYREKILKS